MTETRFYTVSFRNPERAARMSARFAKVGIPLTFVSPVGPDDSRIPRDLDRGSAIIWAIMWSHLDMLRAFVDEPDDGVKYGVFCEDDIYIRRDLPRLLPILKATYESYNLNVLLMGYLHPYPPVDVRINGSFMQIDDIPQLSFVYYPHEVWGAQMYLVSKSHARALLGYYTEDFARRSRDPKSGCGPFSADWTLTKYGRRALVYPMMAVEEGRPDSVTPGEMDFHQRCSKANYDPAVHE